MPLFTEVPRSGVLASSACTVFSEAIATARCTGPTPSVTREHPAIPEPYNGPRIGKIDPDPYKSFGVSLKRRSGFGRARGLPAENKTRSKAMPDTDKKVWFVTGAGRGMGVD